MDAEARRIITEAYDRTRQLLSDNKDKLTKVCILRLLEMTLLKSVDDICKYVYIKYLYQSHTQLAEALLEKETLTYDDVEKLIGPPPFGKKRLMEPAEFEKSDPTRESSSMDGAAS